VRVLAPWLLVLAGAAPLASQEIKPADPGTKMRVNYLNVCLPGEDEQKEIQAALRRIPAHASFTPDFEISRGRVSLENAATSRYLRLRRDMPARSGFDAAQYSLSADPQRTVETLVLKLENPKDLVSITLEDQVSSSAAGPATVLDVDTPVSRIKLERFGKASLVLARCEETDQKAYDPIFVEASRIFALYRRALGLRTLFRGDLAWLAAPPAAAPRKKSHPTGKKP
jgi:hypothetical protein